MNFKILILGLSVRRGLIVTIVLGLAHERLVVVWLGILLTRFSKIKNHFISLLLILEILSLGRLAVSRFFVKTAGTLNLIFVLISLRVGEAVLGLAILVKLIRFNSRELVLTGLS
jgi:NADH:ubiquinone oxidoreductase subunit K